MPIEFKELFFSDPRVQVDKESGYIWKPVLRAGKWAIGPGGRPLHVIPGRSINQHRAIGLQDIVDNFDKIEHVTIPTSHDDDDVTINTGYIRALKIVKNGTDHLLMAAHDFTEPDIKGKVERGTIPNTSVGLEFGYKHKESGKTIPVVLKHVALTHRPWINRLTPFGVAASEETKDDDYTIEALEFSEPDTPEEIAHFQASAWNPESDIEAIRAKIATTIGADFEPVTMARDSVLIRDKAGKQFVVNYTVGDDGTVAVPPAEGWVEHNLVPESTPTPPPPSEPAAIIPAKPDPGKEPEVTDPTIETVEELRTRLAAAEATAAEERAAREQLQGTVASLSEDKRERDAEDFLTEIRTMGLDETAGCTDLLVFVRNICLSDEGASTVLLSETGDEAPKPVTVTKLLRDLFAKLPTDDKTKKIAIKLSEQHSDPLRQSRHGKPPIEPEGLRLSEDDEGFEEQQDELAAELAQFNGAS